MLGFGQYLTYFYGQLPVAAAALGMAVLLVLVNYRGVKETGALQNLIVVALLGLIIVFVALGLFQIDAEQVQPFNPKGWAAVGTTAATVYVSSIGFEVIATSAEEIKDPGRTLPLSIIAAVLSLTLLYALVMLVSTGILSPGELAGSRVPVASVALEYLGRAGAVLMVLGAVLATVSSANASILSAAWVNFAMGRDRILSDWLNQIHSTYRTLYRAILLTGLVILLLITMGVGLETLADVASFIYLLTYALVHAAVIVMRRADPADYQPDFKLTGWMYPAIPFLGFISCVVILFQIRPLVLLLGGGIILLGILWYWFYGSSRISSPSLVGEAIVGRNVWEVVRNVVREEKADQVLLGWAGQRKRTQHFLGSNIDHIVRDADCEVSLGKPGNQDMSRIVALAGQGPYSALAARRGHEFARENSADAITLLNLHLRDEDEVEAELYRAGEDIV